MSEKYIGVKFEVNYLDKFTPTKIELKKITSLIEAGHDLALLKTKDQNGGNFSFRTKDGMIIKVTGAFPYKLKIKDFVKVVDIKKDQVYIKGQYEPSSEARLHWLIYQACPEVNYILHTHDFLVLNSKLKFVDTGYVEQQSYGTEALAKAVVKQAKKYNYIIEQGHGVIALAKTLKQSLKIIYKHHEDAQGAS